MDKSNYKSFNTRGSALKRRCFFIEFFVLGVAFCLKDIKNAAKALEPLVHSFPDAGFPAKLIFSIGIIGPGLLAVFITNLYIKNDKINMVLS
jgi:hypothetical protein